MTSEIWLNSNYNLCMYKNTLHFFLVKQHMAVLKSGCSGLTKLALPDIDRWDEMLEILHVNLQ